MANGLNQSDNQMNFGFGTRTIGGTELDLDAILGARNTSSLLDTLGLLGTGLPTDAFYTINPDTVQALDPNNPMYQQRITDLQQTALPSLQRSALNIGAGGRLGRSEGFMRNLRQQSRQPYLDSLASTFRGIESDVGRARVSAENYLQDILSGFSDLDFNIDNSLDFYDPERVQDAYSSAQSTSGGSVGVGMGGGNLPPQMSFVGLNDINATQIIFPNGSTISTEGLTWDENRGRWDLSSLSGGGM